LIVATPRRPDESVIDYIQRLFVEDRVVGIVTIEEGDRETEETGVPSVEAASPGGD
jgi:hypothetical protein